MSSAEKPDADGAEKFDVDAEEWRKQFWSADAGDKADAKPTEPALYAPLDPPFVVSFAEKGGETRFVQLTLQAMARNEKSIDAIKTHAPAIRNAFLFVISAHKVEDLETLEGKEKLRAEMLKSANEVMEKNTGKADAIEELYFTSLVIQ